MSSSQSSRSWKVTGKGSVILKARIRGEDAETSYGVIFRLVYTRAGGNPLVMTQVCELTFDHNLNRAEYNFDDALPAWFTPKEFGAFVKALESLIPQKDERPSGWGKETL